MGVALTTTGYVYSLLSSFFSVVVFNFFFTEPSYSLRSSPDYVATFAVMFTAALLSSSLTSRINAQSIQTANKACNSAGRRRWASPVQRDTPNPSVTRVNRKQPEGHTV